jgi:LysR family transcriptional regulator, glycine cleavage system transcriptional activator
MTVPLVRLSSLDLVRGFVAVGRRMSITQGAEDLCITQSAMSKQIKALEDQLGVRLLVRGHRAIAFTPEGRALFDAANAAVQQLQQAYGAALTAGDERPVVITAPTGVAGLWLSARLGRFQLAHPGIEVKLSSNNALVDLQAEGIDLAIRYCHDEQAPAGAVRLFGDTVAPVASPSLGLKSLMSPKALASLILLEFDDKRLWLQWAGWFESVGWSGVKPKGMLRFNQYDQVIQAAVEGQGVAIGRLQILSHLLADGRLIVLPHPPHDKQSGHGYWLMQAQPEPRRNIRRFVDWLVKEAAELNAQTLKPL